MKSNIQTIDNPCTLLYVYINLPLSVVWQWQDENKAWQPYAPSVCRKLEASFLSDQSSDVKVIAAGQSYTIHLSLMEQENDKTGVVRKVWKKGWRGPAPSHVTSKRVKSGKSAAKKQKPNREDEEDDGKDKRVILSPRLYQLM